MARCAWADSSPVMREYHDREWGRPRGRTGKDDRALFEFLILEGAQAGLSWATILNKRAAYRRAFAAFDPKKVAAFDAKRRAALFRHGGAAPGAIGSGAETIVKNRLKIDAAVTNARAFLAVQREFGTFGAYLWQWTSAGALRDPGRFGPTPGGKTGGPIVNRPRAMRDVASRTALSDALSKDLKRRGFKFVGTTIVYAYMQAMGMVNDHVRGCGAAGGRRGSRTLPRRRAGKA